MNASTRRGTDPLPIRPARTNDPREVDRLYDICLLTGDGGQDASALYTDHRLLGEIYLGAYLALEPDLAFVLDAGAGPVDGASFPGDGAGPVGYVIGARDTAAFEAACERSWWPALRERYPLGSFAPDSPDERLVRLIHAPSASDPAILVEYPAHLHVDVLPEGQGGGNGRRLLETFFDALRAAGVGGVHLGVAATNTNAIGFYRHLGFTQLRADAYSQTLGLRL